MIQILKPTECCGCNGCVQVCPKSCISFDEDKEGFRYPSVDLNKCIGCNLCERVCPVLNVPSRQNIKKVYAAINEDEKIRIESSSGAVLNSIAEKILKDGGIVFGSIFDNEWEVRHQGIQNLIDIKKIRGSKYLQSRIDNTYKEIKSYLESGYKVLFTGTPCQVAGLNNFLRKKYNNLFCIDFICHGVPSPKVWRHYLKEIISKEKLGESIRDIKSVNFRAKSLGWKSYSLRIVTKKGVRDISHLNDLYCRAFNRNMILRPICHQCPFKNGHSGSNLTLADFWGIQNIDPEMFDDKGTSMIISYENDFKEFNKLKIKEEKIECVHRYNSSYFHSATIDDNRGVFFGNFSDTKSVIDLLKRCVTPSLLQRILNKIYRYTHNL